MSKKLQKFIAMFVIAVALISTNITQGNAWNAGSTVTLSAATTSLFANATTAIPRASVNRGTQVTVDSFRATNTRWFIFVSGGTVEQHNGWLGGSFWINENNLR